MRACKRIFYPVPIDSCMYVYNGITRAANMSIVLPSKVETVRNQHKLRLTINVAEQVLEETDEDADFHMVY